MKKTGVIVATSLIIVLLLSFLTSWFVVPVLKDLFSKRTYSQTNCLTTSITKDMDIYDIAKSYRDGLATVAVSVSGYNTSTKSMYESLGSGVCVASKGYKTSLSNEYTASKGSYIVTNYHVIDLFDCDEFTNLKLSIITEREYTYPCDLLWYNQDLDVAVVYCDNVNLNYVTMKDRLVDCEKNDRLDYEQIFTIGTPLELDYLNRLTVGNIASNNPMMFFTTKEIYPYNTSAGSVGFTYYPSSLNTRNPKTVLSNLYEDVVDIALGISPGNSGGGCFDKNGYLIGLSTLGGDVEETNGNQMNGMVSIYPVIKVLDKLIDNNENKSNNKIYTLETLKIKGLDSIEAAYASYIKEDTGYSNYYLDGQLYSSSYKSAFSFEEDGYYLLSSENTLGLPKNCYINSCSLNNEENVDIIDRNDLIYFLLNLSEGDVVKLNYTNSLGIQKTLEKTL